MKNETDLSKPYLFAVLFLTLFFPAFSVLVESLIKPGGVLTIALVGKWFIFWAIGIRLFSAGLRQTISPAFTAKSIFHIDHKDSLVIVRELGFANICFGVLGIMSLIFPQWRIVSAFGSGIYYGMAGCNHLIKGSAGSNEKIALISDIFVFLCLLVYVLLCFNSVTN
jgi:hypothetical protein